MGSRELEQKLDGINNYLSIIQGVEEMIEDILIKASKSEISLGEYTYHLDCHFSGVEVLYHDIIEMSRSIHRGDLVEKYTNEERIINKNHEKFADDPFLYLQIQEEVLRRKNL